MVFIRHHYMLKTVEFELPSKNNSEPTEYTVSAITVSFCSGNSVKNVPAN